MPIPQEILAVPRPKNSIVIAYGKNKDRYAVRKRVGCRNVEGRHLPVNGPTIGHIVNGKFVPKEEPEAPQEAPEPELALEVKRWADAALCERHFSGELDALVRFFPQEDALALYVLTILRLCSPWADADGIREAWEQSFLSESRPKVELSAAALEALLRRVGADAGARQAYFRERTAAAGEAKGLFLELAAYGALPEPSLSCGPAPEASSWRGLLCAVDLESGEPVCAAGAPDEEPSGEAWLGFMQSAGIASGILVSEKNPDDAKGLKTAALRRLSPLRRGAKPVRALELLSGMAPLPGSTLLYKKASLGVKRWFYAYRDPERAAGEEKAWRRKKLRKGSAEAPSEGKRSKFGTFLFESDLDLPADFPCRAAGLQRSLEAALPRTRLFRSDDPDLSEGEAFADFLFVLLTFRLLRAMVSAEGFSGCSLRGFLSRLAGIRKGALASEAGSRTKKRWQLLRLTAAQKKALQPFGLLDELQPSRRKPGRPRKKPD